MKRKLILAFWVFLLISPPVFYAQCEMFSEVPNGDEGKKNHVIYRDFLKAEKFEKAFPFWQKAYTIAPRADGKRHYHFSDGIEIYKNFYEEEKSGTQKKEYEEKILNLYKHWIECLGKEGKVEGLKGLDMYWLFESDQETTFKILKKSFDLQKGKVDSDYLYPLIDLGFKLYEEEKFKKPELLELILLLRERITFFKGKEDNYDKENAVEAEQLLEEYVDYFEPLYDCPFYMKEKDFEQMASDYWEHAEDLKILREEMEKFKCMEHPLYQKVRARYKKLTTKPVRVLTSLEKARQADNAKQYKKAIKLYEKSINEQKDKSKKVNALLRMALLEYGKLRNFSQAKKYLMEVQELNPGEGKTYMMLAEMYLMSVKECANNKMDESVIYLLAINKWKKAKELDSSLEKEANEKIQKYLPFTPQKEEIFMRSLKGKKYKIGCWIQESVIL